jgi:hypothetical protein
MSVGSWSNATTGYTNSNGWTTVASSSTGQYCIAGNRIDRNLWTSSNYGVTWAVTSGANAPQNDYWRYVAITSDGNRMASCVGEAGSLPATVYLLDKNGANANTWINIIPNPTYNPGTNPGIATNWLNVAFSVDGNTIAACNEIGDIWLYKIATSTWSIPPNVSNYIPEQFPARGGNISSNASGFIFAARQNSIYTVYNDGSGGYITSIWTVGNAYIDSGPYDGYPWTSISSSLDGTKIVLCANSGSDSSIDKIYIGTFVPVAPGGNFSGSTTLQIFSQSAPGIGAWNVVATGPDAVSIAASKANSASPGEIWVGNLNYGSTTYAWTRQNMQNGSPLLGDWFSISRSTDPTQFTKFVTVPQNSVGSQQTGIWVFTSFQTAGQAQEPPPLTCFRKDTKILTDHGYVPVQNLKKGDLIKTLDKGFVPLYNIGRKNIYNPSLNERIKDQLYVCSHKNYPEVFEDLVITGCHSILVPEFKEGEREKTSELLGRIFITDNRYRLPACIDARAEIYFDKGEHTIYHFALENDDRYMNYGIYANGLLVETCSKRYLLEESKMTLM